MQLTVVQHVQELYSLCKESPWMGPVAALQCRTVMCRDFYLFITSPNQIPSVSFTFPRVWIHFNLRLSKVKQDAIALRSITLQQTLNSTLEVWSKGGPLTNRRQPESTWHCQQTARSCLLWKVSFLDKVKITYKGIKWDRGLFKC